MKIWFALLITFSSFGLQAQNYFGPKLNAMGNHGAAIPDVWSVQGNPAAISFLRHPAAASRYGKPFFNQEISTQALACILPFKNNTIGLVLQRYGFSAYQESQTGITYAKHFGSKYAIGIRANYYQLKISQYGTSRGFSVDVGFLYRVNSVLNIGAYTCNPARQKFNSPALQYKIPTLFSMGTAYQASKQVLIVVSVNKDISQPVDFGFGLDYQMTGILDFRGGLTVQPFRQYAGIGLKHKNFNWDLSTTFDPTLGYSPQIGITYVF